ncbi:MAG: type II secretion system inner membrane protein GspF [Pseudomonadaceae bacterium]|nr:type II secretion system inner membrane protein GspF [Pseudomonadaceae bacterium]
MAAFEYSALDDRGKQQKGVLEADSIRQVRQLLRDKGLAPLAVEPASQRSKTLSLQGFNRKLTGLDQVLFTRQLATLINAGLPIEEALRAVAQQSEKRHVSSLIMAVRSRVLEGYSIAAALAEFPTSFGQLYVSTVAAGEQSGFLDKVLENLADYLERRFESRRNVEMALFYPALILVAALLMIGGLMVYVVPGIVEMFDQMDQNLPLMTQILISVSSFSRDYWWLMLLVAVAAVFTVRWLLQNPALRLAWDERKLSMPLFGRISRLNNAARYASTLSILGSSGVPLVDAMNIAGDVVSNTWLRRKLADATVKVSEGGSLRNALEGVSVFPPMFLHMVASGEASGELDTMLERISKYQQDELERLVTTLVKLFEPTMLLGMGALVMMIVAAILVPILSINQTI